MARSRSRSRSSDGTSDHNERPEPQLLRAAEADDVEAIARVLESAKAKGLYSETLLRIGLMRSSEKGRIGATRYLLSIGAPPDGADPNRLAPLLHAVTRNHIAIVHLLLEYGANVETADKKGRTALMTSAWRNHCHILELLIKKGANVNTKDSRGRNVLHNLAADKTLDWGDSVIELLLTQYIRIDGQEGRDELRRSPLHWACATGKLHLAEKLLTRPYGPNADINASDSREKRALHIAAAHDRDDIVEMLLKYHADVNARSDGGWTPLHNAADKGSEKIVRVLLQAGADINARLLNGMTALHLASQQGHVTIVKCLLECNDIKKAVRDSFGSTPFLRAAQSRNRQILELLAPFNDEKSLSEDARGALEGFQATIVDFGDFHNENRVTKKSVFELLYARDRLNKRKPAISVLPRDKVISFRWIHLPSNNTSWVETLLSKYFIEEGASDIIGFKALERSLSHQHRGRRSHSYFMRPLSQSTPRAPPSIQSGEPMGLGISGSEPPTIVINGVSRANGSKTPPLNGSTSAENKGFRPKSSSSHVKEQKEKEKEKENEKGKKNAKRGGKSPKLPETPARNNRRSSSSFERIRRSPGSPGPKDPPQAPKANIFAFMPYFNFETYRNLKEMQDAIKRAENSRPFRTKAASHDEMLIRAHLASSTVSLHIRRTLDQFFYHNIDTQTRDQDQVVLRYQCEGKDLSEVDPKLVMVDQLWLWVLSKDLIITSFPQRWQQPKNDPHNVLDGIIEDINSKTRHPIHSVWDLAETITAKCTGVVDRRVGDEYQVLDMFESSLGNATDKETSLFRQFHSASSQASAWLRHHRRANRFSDTDTDRIEQEHKFKFEAGPLFVDKLLDIGQEAGLLDEIKDIRDELNQLSKVLDDQRTCLPDLSDAICEIYRDEQRSQQDVKKRFRDQLKTISEALSDIDRMGKQAERIYNSIRDLLDLKQKHANAFEARFARDQAEGSARTNQTIMVFTIVTIIFLPLSFIAAFFTINIDEFPNANGSNSLPLGYVSKYMFSISFAISVPLIIIALSLENISELYREVGRKWRQRKKKRKGMEPCMEDQTLDICIRIEKPLSALKSAERDLESYSTMEQARRSKDTTERREVIAPSRDKAKTTAFRLHQSGDIEKGL